MTRNKYLYILAMLSLSLTACHDDFESLTGGGVDEEGNIHVAFSLSPLVTTSTRATDALDKVHVYAYGTNGASVEDSDLKVTLVDEKTQTYTGFFKPSDELAKNINSAKFYFVANMPTFKGTADTSTEGNLIGTMATTVVSSDEHFTLSSKGIGISAVKNSTISLVHNAAKISVHNAVLKAGSDNEYEAGSQTYPFNTAGMAEESLLLAGGLSEDGTKSMGGYPTEQNYSSFTVTDAEKIVHPTLNTGDHANQAFIIVKAPYENHDYYYRLDFQMADKLQSGVLTSSPFDIISNHHYQFLIKSINGMGYSTPEEAAKSPTPMVDFQIHDHAPVIYNMISDGSRELGVGKEVVNRNAANNSTATLNIKFFSPYEAECNELTSENWQNYIKINDDWLKVKSVTKLTGEENVGNDVPDSNHAGVVYGVELEFLPTLDPGTLETEISVTWHGLTRDVPVTWRRDFNTADLLESVEVKFFSNSSTRWTDSSQKHFTDYFGNFLPNESVGTSAIANNDEARDDGLHFPISYGSDSKWTYMYMVTLNNKLFAGGETCNVSAEGVSDIEFSTSGTGNWTTTISRDGSNRVFYVRCTDTGYTYSKGNLVLSLVTNVTRKSATYKNIKLYHTGFFHKDDTSHVRSEQTTHPSKYTYYEVVTNGTDHWLDRNIGATAATPYIINGFGDAGAAGYYLVAAKYHKYNAPDIYDGIVPPGYSVPTQEQWDNLKGSADFTSSLYGGAFYNVSYAAPEKLVYFQKSQYYEGSGLQGDNRAGYYWTRTPSTGTEKDEVGNWLKCMTMTGTATSYINGRVEGKDASQQFYMSLRAVSQSSTTTPKRLSFWVKGATHVFLYTLDEDKNRVPVTSWPGKAIGNYSTADKDFNFSYESSTAALEDFYVIFNYVNEKGQIYTMSKNNFSGNTNHYNISPSVAEGWKVIGSKKSSDFGETDCGVTVDKTTTDNTGTHWTCTPEIPAISDKYGSEERTYRILWPNTGYTEIRIISQNEGTPVLVDKADATWTNYDYDGTKYGYEFKTKITNLKFKLEFYNSNGQKNVPKNDPTYTTNDFIDLHNNGTIGMCVYELN